MKAPVRQVVKALVRQAAKALVRLAAVEVAAVAVAAVELELVRARARRAAPAGAAGVDAVAQTEKAAPRPHRTSGALKALLRSAPAPHPQTRGLPGLPVQQTGRRAMLPRSGVGVGVGVGVLVTAKVLRERLGPLGARAPGGRPREVSESGERSRCAPPPPTPARRFQSDTTAGREPGLESGCQTPTMDDRLAESLLGERGPGQSFQ